MLSLSRMADYGASVLAHMAAAPVTLHTAPALAESTGYSEATVAKVLKALGRANLVISVRGAQGGYRLARPAACITVAEVVEAIDGPINLTKCASNKTNCCHHSKCPAHPHWHKINTTVRNALAGITVHDLSTEAM